MTFSGVFVPLVTPFDADGAVALAALDRLAHEVLDAGASGLVALGTTGEPSTLSPGEQRAVVEVVAAVCREHGAPLVVGGPAPVGIGGDAVLSLVPPFLRPGEAGVIAHFAAAGRGEPDSADRVSRPVPHRSALLGRAIRGWPPSRAWPASNSRSAGSTRTPSN